MFLITSYHLLLVRKGRMQDLLQDLQAIRLILSQRLRLRMQKASVMKIICMMKMMMHTMKKIMKQVSMRKQKRPKSRKLLRILYRNNSLVGIEAIE